MHRVRDAPAPVEDASDTAGTGVSPSARRTHFPEQSSLLPRRGRDMVGTRPYCRGPHLQRQIGRAEGGTSPTPAKLGVDRAVGTCWVGVDVAVVQPARPVGKMSTRLHPELQRAAPHCDAVLDLAWHCDAVQFHGLRGSPVEVPHWHV